MCVCLCHACRVLRQIKFTGELKTTVSLNVDYFIELRKPAAKFKRAGFLTCINYDTIFLLIQDGCVSILYIFVYLFLSKSF